MVKDLGKKKTPSKASSRNKPQVQPKNADCVKFYLSLGSLADIETYVNTDPKAVENKEKILKESLEASRATLETKWPEWN